MKCGKPVNVCMILIGLHQVGVIGLRDALRAADAAGLEDREKTVDFLLEALSRENYVPDAQRDAYRTALWREVLRHRGRDFREFYSEVEVEIGGADGSDRDRFVELLVSVFGDFELRPVVRFVPAAEEEAGPSLVLGGETVARGLLPRAQLKAAVRRRISEW
ncbi:MAG: hypothetical protein GF328_03835 [Candidatus Latescibacteria bacterium]|nr:hypothetical protein [Candidatus Latescibacterota bacterium]